ncbi:MAG: gliding motility-associated C-terminal domain-containing protein [Bacteroidota bacterium]|jgi:gliding motility-associated-like protein
MSINKKVDELLRNELSDFKSDPPAELWNSISHQINQIPAINPAASATKVATGSVKAFTLTSKIAVAIITAVTTGVSLLGYQFVSQPSDKDSLVIVGATEQSIEQNIAAIQSEQVNEAVFEKVEQPVIHTEPQIEESSVSIETAKPKNTLSDDGHISIKEITPAESAPSSAPPADQVVVSTEDVHVSSNINKEQIISADSLIVVAKSDVSEMNNQENDPTQQAELDKQNGGDSFIQKAVMGDLGERKQSPIDSLFETYTEADFSKPQIPNVFTPFNHDGYNDEFVITIDNETLYELKITDQVGKIVFETKNKTKFWNGTNVYNGTTCEPGIYMVTLKYQIKGMQVPEVYNGLLLLKQ